MYFLIFIHFNFIHLNLSFLILSIKELFKKIQSVPIPNSQFETFPIRNSNSKNFHLEIFTIRKI